jgi:hypothetical protein
MCSLLMCSLRIQAATTAASTTVIRTKTADRTTNYRELAELPLLTPPLLLA